MSCEIIKLNVDSCCQACASLLLVPTARCRSPVVLPRGPFLQSHVGAVSQRPRIVGAAQHQRVRQAKPRCALRLVGGVPSNGGCKELRSVWRVHKRCRGAVVCLSHSRACRPCHPLCTSLLPSAYRHVYNCPTGSLANLPKSFPSGRWGRSTSTLPALQGPLSTLVPVNPRHWWCHRTRPLPRCATQDKTLPRGARSDPDLGRQAQ